MTAEQFAYWMQGFAELSGDAPPTVEQWKSICEHLVTVFTKVTPALDFTPRVDGPLPERQFIPPTYIPQPVSIPGLRPGEIMRTECAVANGNRQSGFEPLANGAETV